MASGNESEEESTNEEWDEVWYCTISNYTNHVVSIGTHSIRLLNKTLDKTKEATVLSYFMMSKPKPVLASRFKDFHIRRSVSCARHDARLFVSSFVTDL